MAPLSVHCYLILMQHPLPTHHPTSYHLATPPLITSPSHLLSRRLTVRRIDTLSATDVVALIDQVQPSALVVCEFVEDSEGGPGPAHLPEPFTPRSDPRLRLLSSLGDIAVVVVGPRDGDTPEGACWNTADYP